MTETKNYDILDLAKLILSIMIVAIHTSLLPSVLYPWLRLALPLFFVISSFLLFRKINNSPQSESDNIIKKFIRYAKLYLFWFIVLLPFTIYIRKDWFILGFWNGISNMIKNILFSSTFVASWFLTATITAIFIIYKLSKKFNYKLLFFIFLLIYFVCCMVSSYYTFFENIDFIKKICDFYLLFFPSPLFSFPVALLWIFIGKMFADGNIKHKIVNKKLYLLFTALFFLLLFIEWKYVTHLTETYTSDCYLFLFPLTILIFKLFLNINIKLKNAKLLRQVSTITYPLHASIAFVFFRIIRLFTNNITLIGILNFVATLSFCYIICYIIFKLENKKYFKLLKYSH